MPPIGSSVDISCRFLGSIFGRDEPQPVLSRCAKLFGWLHRSMYYSSRAQRAIVLQVSGDDGKGKSEAEIDGGEGMVGFQAFSRLMGFLY